MNAATGLLSADARAAAYALDEVLPRPFHELGVAGSRALAALLRPSGPPEPVAAVSDIELAGRDSSILARLYRPSGSSTLPVIGYLHGGGWTLGSLDGVDAVCRALANRSGAAVVSVDYRLAPEHRFPLPLEDCVDAIAYLATEGAGRLGVDPRRIALVGDSAGGNLAIGVAQVLRDAGVDCLRCQVLVYPATEIRGDRPSWHEFADGPLVTTQDVEWFWQNYLRDEADTLDPHAVPAAAATLSRLPRTLVITAEVDPLRDGAEAFAHRLLDDGVEVSISRYRGVFHGFFTEVGTYQATDAAVHEAARFVRDALRDEGPAR